MSAALRLEPVSFAALEGFDAEDHAAAFAVFRAASASVVEGRQSLRTARAPSAGLIGACRSALAAPGLGQSAARQFFEANFAPFRLASDSGAKAGFFTGYYEPIVDGSLIRTENFTAPILSRPEMESDAEWPDRAAIDAGALGRRARPIVWLKDRVEAFLIQVQGSARARLPDGRLIRLKYAGRNGWPYTSIGRILIESGAIAERDMSLAALKGWIRAQGQAEGEAGARLMARNQSFVFFAVESEIAAEDGPIGGAGLSLTPRRSLAVDRAHYAYATPVWVDAGLPQAAGGRLRRLMIAQDTGSAIVGEARADIFFGSGDEAGARAGDVRHAGEFVVFLPVGECAAGGAEEGSPP